MKSAAALATSFLLIAPGLGRAAVEVRVAGQAVDVLASNAPLTEVLDRLSRQTQMKVVYEGTPPRQTVSLDLRGRTPVEAVVAALEGQGVNYAMSMDETGTRVQTLLVTGTAASSAPTRAAGGAVEFPDRHAAREMAVASEAVIEEPEPVPEDDGAPPPPDTTVGLNAANPQTLGKESQPDPAAAPPADGGSGWSASPFAPAAPPAVTKTDPTPKATPPPFNP